MFTNKVVIITGASAGIGEAAAIHFAKEDALLAITGRNKENLQKVADQCLQNSPNKLNPLTIVADLNIESDVEKVINTTIEKYGKLDVLVNNAGVLLSGSIETTTLEQYDTIMNTNVRAPYYLTMLAVPQLLKVKGNIVNVSSHGVSSHTLKVIFPKTTTDGDTSIHSLMMIMQIPENDKSNH